MRIVREDHEAFNTESTRPAVENDSSTDINWFSSEFTRSSQHSPASTPQNVLTERSSKLGELTSQGAHQLKRVSQSLSPIEILNTSRALSKAHLNIVLTTKVVNKMTQCVEKISNLG